MKKILFIVSLALCLSGITYAQVGVGTFTISENSQLQVDSDSSGLLVPRLNANQVTALETALGDLTTNPQDSGMVIFNITENCLQVYDGSKFKCVSLVSGGSTGNAGVVKVNIRSASNQTASTAASTGDATHPGYMKWETGGNPTPPTYLAASFGQFDFVASDLVLSSFPTTNWPENENNPTLTGGVYTDDLTFTSTPVETEDAWRENDVPGQVHIWRITLYGNPGSSSGGQLELRLRNPQSGFVTGYAQPIPATSGLYAQTFTITTIADDASLPIGTGSGTGNGYIIEIRSNSNSQEIWIDNITRISNYNE